MLEKHGIKRAADEPVAVRVTDAGAAEAAGAAPAANGLAPPAKKTKAATDIPRA